MTKVILSGCSGRMGSVITQLAADAENVKIVAGVDVVSPSQSVDYPVYAGFEECPGADVIIDFAAAVAVDNLLQYSKDKNIPVVLCTTGLSEEQLANVKATSEKVAILKSANMSLGVNTLIKILKDAARVFGTAGYDIEVVEQHHRLKVDAPSGTALALADSVNEALNNEYEYVFDRSQRREKRPDKEIGISAVRGGTIVGIHDVIFAGADEVITFNHTAYSKSVFAKGAIEAGKFLAGKAAGMYDMADVIEAK